MRKSYGLTLALALVACAFTHTACAQDAAYIVSYFETTPAAQNDAAALARAFGEASRSALASSIIFRSSKHGAIRRHSRRMPLPRIPNSSARNCSRCCAPRTTSGRTQVLRWGRCRQRA